MHCPQPLGKIERADGLIKQHTKLFLKLRLSWSSLLPFAQATLSSPKGLGPFEYLYRPFLFKSHLLTQAPPLAVYLPCLSFPCSPLSSHSDNHLPTPTSVDSATVDPFLLCPGDQALLKQLSSKSLEPWWMGPYTVILTRPLTDELQGHQCWYHLSGLKKSLTQDGWSTQHMGPISLGFCRDPQEQV